MGGLGGKAVLLYTGHVDQLGPAAQLGLVLARPAGHGVGVHIHRVHRVTHGHHVVHPEDVADVAAVALGAVGDEDLLGLHVHAPGGVVVLGDGLPQEVVALLGAVTVEALKGAHLGNGLVHGLNDRGGQRAGHVADGQLDDLGLRMGGGVDGDPPGHLGKQVAAGELQEVLIYLCHMLHSFFRQDLCAMSVIIPDGRALVNGYFPGFWGLKGQFLGFPFP